MQEMLTRFDDKIESRFNRIDDRLEKLDDKIEGVSKTTDRNTVVLEEHQRRSAANEETTKLLSEQVMLQRQETAALIKASEDSQEKKVKELAETVEPYVKFPRYVAKIATWVAAVVGGIGALYGVVKFALRRMAE
jgi:Skp family chaperone for outer membrane proteins